MLLEGQVNKIGADHIGILVYGVFNATITKDQVPMSQGSEEDSNPGAVGFRTAKGELIEVGSKIVFRISGYVNYSGCACSFCLRL